MLRGPAAIQDGEDWPLVNPLVCCLKVAASAELTNQGVAENLESIVNKPVTTNFRTGDTVVEPSLGVCRVQGIRPMTVDGIAEDYYIFQSPTAKVMVPRSQLARRGVRRPMSKEGIRKIANTLRMPVTPQRGDAREQYLLYQETLNSGDPMRISKLLRNLFILEQSDDLKGKEKELMEKARKFLVEEITFIKGTPKTQVANDINEHLRLMYKKKVQQDKGPATAKKNVKADSKNKKK